MASISVFNSSSITVSTPGKVHSTHPVHPLVPCAHSACSAQRLSRDKSSARCATRSNAIVAALVPLLIIAMQYSWLPDVLRLKGSVSVHTTLTLTHDEY